MILSRAPLRITLGGGGTDLKSYYSQYGGFLIAAGIDRYCTILVNRRFYDEIRLSYSEMEIVESVDQIKHRIFREALKMVDINKNIELHSTADVPSSSGLGSSSCFTVALMNALHAYKGEYNSKCKLAEEARHIEINLLLSSAKIAPVIACKILTRVMSSPDKNGNALMSAREKVTLCAV